ncbi:helix-turn-helix domain-containing protein [Paenibacillus sp.]|uniref:helix-turn-helix domain-containing protein n=1 Tax=Paenibacillus sp. TaxID=58172 RepID=UPI002810EBDC|nr:helix-turn-helix domain-containing protein [Paenibacillus sp.]
MEQRLEAYGGEAKGLAIAGRFRVPDTYVVDRPTGRDEDDWIIVYTLEGAGYVRTTGQEHRLGPGDILLLNASVPHAYGTCAGEIWGFVWAHFSPERMDASFLPTETATVAPIADASARRRIVRAFRRVLIDARDRGDFWNELCYGALQEVLAIAARQIARRIDPRIEEARRLLAANMREPVRIEALAKAVGLSPSRLSHLFKETTGQSIVDALNAMRVRQAALLLEHTRRGAAEIAYEVGFQNYNHFLAQFRRRFGASPTGYRRGLRLE